MCALENMSLRPGGGGRGKVKWSPNRWDSSTWGL